MSQTLPNEKGRLLMARDEESKQPREREPGRKTFDERQAREDPKETEKWEADKRRDKD